MHLIVEPARIKATLQELVKTHPHQVAEEGNSAGNEDCKDHIDGPVDQPENSRATHALLCHQCLNHVKDRHPAMCQCLNSIHAVQQV